MKDQIVSELRKLTTTRSAYALLVGLMVAVGVGAVAVIAGGSRSSVLEPLQRQTFLNVVRSITPIFALMLGIRSFTDEFRFGSIVPTLLADPRRGRVLAAKVVAAGIGGVALALAATVAATAIGVPLLLIHGWVPAWSGGAFAVVVGRLLAATVLWTTIGVGFGLAVRHQVAAVAGALVWMIAGEGIVAGLLPHVARFFPGAAGFSIVGVNTEGLLAPVAAAALLCGYAAAALTMGAVLMARRDIA